MAKKIRMNLSHKSIQRAIDEIENYRKELKRKNQIFVEKLSRIGINVIRETMESIPDEEKGKYYVESLNNSSGDMVGVAIRLSGTDVLFVEFSAGTAYGTPQGGYPLEYGSKYGAGTYPGQTHANDPNGWWYLDENGNKHHSYGNRAYMPMYHASEAIILAIRHVAEEVFR